MVVIAPVLKKNIEISGEHSFQPIALKTILCNGSNLPHTSVKYEDKSCSKITGVITEISCKHYALILNQLPKKIP